MNESLKSNSEMKKLLLQILNYPSKRTLTPAEVIGCLNARCYPKQFDALLFKAIISKPGVMENPKSVLLDQFIQQYIDLKDSTEFEWMNCKNNLDQQSSQRDQRKQTQPNDVNTVSFTLWIRTVTITSMKQQAEQAYTISIDYQSQISGQTSPYKFKDSICLINEQLSIVVANNPSPIMIRLMQGKLCIGIISLDLGKLSQNATSEINEPFIINNMTPLSNEYSLQALGLFGNVTSESTLDTKQIQQTQSERQATLAALMAPLLKPIPQQAVVEIQPTTVIEQLSRSYISEEQTPKPAAPTKHLVPIEQYHNQPYSQFQLAPPIDRNRNDYPADMGTQTEPKQRPIEIEQPIAVVDESLFEQELVEYLDSKVPLASRTHALLFLTLTGFILACSVLINLFRVQLDLIIILIMWALHKTNKLDSDARKYVFLAFLVNIFIDIVWLCQVNGKWASMSNEPNYHLCSLAYITQNLLICVKVVYSVLLWRFSVKEDMEFTTTIQSFTYIS